ncbi:MAG: BCD family MFS transporter [Hyphomonadaceae bacterium]|nr:BCD family MFS transporter [Hyphomonadaceae bacterium]
MTSKHLGWIGIVRLGLVQSALGAIVVLTTSTLNRVMVVEMALPAILPAALVAWHYGVQLSRPRWGYGSDMGHRRTPWIIGGMGVLALGAILATDATLMMPDNPVLGLVLSVVAYLMIGAGVGASGTSLLALLATRVTPTRRPAAASITWIMMIVGIVVTAATAGALLEPFSGQRLAMVSTGVCAVAFLVTLLAVWNVETAPEAAPAQSAAEPKPSFRQVIAEIWAEPLARRFAVFVFVAMLAYSAQDLILEPFAGLVFGMTPGQSTQLAGVQNGGVLLGMILVGAVGARAGDGSKVWMRWWTVAGCVGSALALCALGMAALVGPGWPLAPTVFALGLANGVFAVAAIGSMMGLAGAGRESREGVRMGVWGASQAIAFGLGGFLGAAGVDVMRHVTGETGRAFLLVFTAEAVLFLAAAVLASRLDLVAKPSASPAPAGTMSAQVRGAQ